MFAVLVLTNVVTWRALVREQAVRLEAGRQQARQDVQVLSSWPASTSQRNALREAVRTGVPQGNGVNAAPDYARIVRTLSDPEAQEALHDQGKMRALDIYGELVKRWHLSGQTAVPVLDALGEYELRQITRELAGDSSATYMNAADDDAVQATLSEKQLEDLRQYEGSLSDRMAIKPFLNELAFEAEPLPVERVEQLVGIMHDERVAVPPPEESSRSQLTTSYSKAFDEWQVALDQRVRDRAALIFSPDFLSRLETFQSSQRNANSIFASLEPETAQPSATSTASDSN